MFLINFNTISKVEYLIIFKWQTNNKHIMGILYALLIGALAGWLAGKIMKGGGYGTLLNIILGIIGGAVGNWLFGTLGCGTIRARGLRSLQNLNDRETGVVAIHEARLEGNRLRARLHDSTSGGTERLP